MMDLGATLCTRAAPACGRCPLAAGCAALGLGDPTAFPAPKPRREVPVREVCMLVLHNPGGRGPAGAPSPRRDLGRAVEPAGVPSRRRSSATGAADTWG